MQQSLEGHTAPPRPPGSSPSRSLSLGAHSVFELLVGLALLIAAFAADVSGGGRVIALAAGALAVGFALASHDGRGRLSPGAHAGLDAMLAVALLIVAALFLLLGKGPDVLLFGIGGAAVGVLALVTRYTSESRSGAP